MSLWPQDRAREPFAEGLAVVTKDRKYRFIDEAGQVVWSKP